MSIICTGLVSLPLLFDAVVIQGKWRLMATISLVFHTFRGLVPFCLKMLLCKKVTFISYIVHWFKSYVDESISAVLLT